MKYKNLKILILITGGLILISGFLSLTLSNPNLQIHSNITNNALAYNDKTTHPDLTREVIAFYELSANKKFTEEQKQWIIQGSIDEDLAPRWLNHFYDPVYERGLTTDIPGVNGYLAKNWAQFSSYQTMNIGNILNLFTGNGPVVSGSEWGDFSYEAAIKNYSQNKEKEAYLALGHVIHLIEDMTVPEHTRNDIHPGGTMVSFYESWTMSNSSGLTQDLGKILFNQGRKLVIYSDLASYFNNLASYTNNHFFSPRTINSEIYAKPKVVYDDGTFAYGRDENGELFDLARIDKFGKDKKWINDDQVLQEYWLRLSRQAVINGAGIINLFSNQAEAAKQVELAKQKVEAQQTAQKSSFFSSIINLFKNPGENNQPALTINSEVQPVAPKIKPVTVQPIQPKTESKPLIIETKPQPKPTPPTLAPTPTPIPTPVPALTPVPTPTPAPVVVYGGGGGSSTNTTPSSSETASDSTSQNSTIQTFSAGDLVINEIMHNPQGSDTDREWIEIYNNSPREVDLTGWKLNDGDGNHGLNIPPDHGGQGSIILPIGSYVILAEDAATFLNDYSGFSGSVIDTAALNLKQDISTVTTLKIITPDGMVINEVIYNNSWGGNDNGKSLERKTAAGGSNDPNNWAESSANGGTPGAANNWLLSILDADNATSTPETATSTTESFITLGTDISATTTIAENTTWTLAGSPYRLFFNNQNRPTVALGATLTIEPGVKIIPQSSGTTALEIRGMLQAIATSGAPIIFTSINDNDGLASTTPYAGDWLNIVFSAGSQGNLDYVEFRYGGQGNLRPLKEMVKIIGATVNINNSTFADSESIALRLVDSNGIIENSVFSDNACGISVDTLKGDGNTDGGCSDGIQSNFPAAAVTTPQIKNNQFIKNRFIAIETRNSSTPVIDSNIFTDNGYPIRIDGAYPTITNSQLTNSTTSPNILGGIAISGYTHFSQNYTLKKDLPYILETNGPAWSPYVDSGVTLTLEPGTIFKTNNTCSVLFIYGSLIASTTPDNPIVFTSLKDDTKGGDTNGDGSTSSPLASDWGKITFGPNSYGNFQNTLFLYGIPGETNYPKTVTVLDKSSESGEVELIAPNFIGSVEQQFSAPIGATSIKASFSVHKKSGTNAQTMGVLLLADNGDQPGTILYNAGNFVVTEDYQVFNIEINKQIQANVKYWLQFNKVDIPIDTDWFFKANTENYGILTTAVIGFNPSALNPQTLSLKITSVIFTSILNVFSIDAGATVVIQ